MQYTTIKNITEITLFSWEVLNLLEFRENEFWGKCQRAVSPSTFGLPHWLCPGEMTNRLLRNCCLSNVHWKHFLFLIQEVWHSLCCIGEDRHEQVVRVSVRSSQGLRPVLQCFRLLHPPPSIIISPSPALVPYRLMLTFSLCLSNPLSCFHLSHIFLLLLPSPFPQWPLCSPLSDSPCFWQEHHTAGLCHTHSHTHIHSCTFVIVRTLINICIPWPLTLNA